MGENLHVCVYERCGKSFTAPVRLTDLSNKPHSATYYACPYCFSKMDESEHNLSHELKLMKNQDNETTTSNNPKKHATPEDTTFQCPHHVGYLKKRSKDEDVPDYCLTCPKILQCMA
jgi:DNA-directed RNA polymerase subunit RPC12/RpoP